MELSLIILYLLQPRVLLFELPRVHHSKANICIITKSGVRVYLIPETRAGEQSFCVESSNCFLKSN